MPTLPRDGDNVNTNQFSLRLDLPGTSQLGIHEQAPLISNTNKNTKADSWTTRQTHPDLFCQVAKCKMEAAGLQKTLIGQRGLLSREANTGRYQNVVGSINNKCA